MNGTRKTEAPDLDGKKRGPTLTKARGVLARYGMWIVAIIMGSSALIDMAHGQVSGYTPDPIAPDCQPGWRWGWSNGPGSSARCYPPQSSCPAGTLQVSAPQWTGAGWTQPQCWQKPKDPPLDRNPAPSYTDQSVPVILISWFPYYDGGWYNEGRVGATKRTYSDGTVKWSTKVFGNGDLILNGNVRAYHVPDVPGPDGMPLFAVDSMCWGVT